MPQDSVTDVKALSMGKGVLRPFQDHFEELYSEIKRGCEA